MLGDSALGEDPLPSLQTFTVASQDGEGTLISFSSYKVTDPIMEALPLQAHRNLNISYRPTL